MIDINVEGRAATAMIDIGCLITVVSSRLVGKSEDESHMVAFDGSHM